MLMQGTLSQTVADGIVTEVRTTGARQDLFQGILPVYMRLALTYVCMVELCITIKPMNYVVDVLFRGVQSGIVLTWRFGMNGNATGSAMVDGVLEWYIPDIFPNLFDEEWELVVDSTGTGCMLSVDYTMYYSIIQSDEMEMVKTIADY